MQDFAINAKESRCHEMAVDNIEAKYVDGIGRKENKEKETAIRY